MIETHESVTEFHYLSQRCTKVSQNPNTGLRDSIICHRISLLVVGIHEYIRFCDTKVYLFAYQRGKFVPIILINIQLTLHSLVLPFQALGPLILKTCFIHCLRYDLDFFRLNYITKPIECFSLPLPHKCHLLNLKNKKQEEKNS